MLCLAISSLLSVHFRKGIAGSAYTLSMCQSSAVCMQLGLGHFADHSRDEYKKMLGYRADLAPQRPLQASPFRYAKSKPPPSVDWREKGAVTDVKNQAQVSTGTCASFAYDRACTCTVGSCRQSHHAGKHRVLMPLQLASSL